MPDKTLAKRNPGDQNAGVQSHRLVQPPHCLLLLFFCRGRVSATRTRGEPRAVHSYPSRSAAVGHADLVKQATRGRRVTAKAHVAHAAADSAAPQDTRTLARRWCISASRPQPQDFFHTYRRAWVRPAPGHLLPLFSVPALPFGPLVSASPVTLLLRPSLFIENARECLLWPVCSAQQLHVSVRLVGAGTV